MMIPLSVKKSNATTSVRSFPGFRETGQLGSASSGSLVVYEISGIPEL
jgi:hypothetical protein